MKAKRHGLYPTPDRIENLRLAISNGEAAVQLNHHNSLSWALLGKWRSQLPNSEQMQQAIVDEDYAIQIDPNNSAAYGFRAIARVFQSGNPMRETLISISQLRSILLYPICKVLKGRVLMSLMKFHIGIDGVLMWQKATRKQHGIWHILHRIILPRYSLRRRERSIHIRTLAEMIHA